MPNVIDYVEASQHESFYDKDFTVLDALALTEIAYLPFEELVPTEILPAHYLSIHQLAERFEEKFQDKYPPLSMVNSHRLKTLGRLSTYKRYKQIRAMAFVNDYSQDNQKQFAAMTYQIRPKEYLVVFRGTDDTLIGWKEDFYMTYMTEIPAQVAAKEYLTQILTNFEGKVWLAGHSKGGNLATFAASQIESEMQERIREIYSFDAPGLHAAVIASDGFNTIENKIHSIIPEHSIVGMLLETPKNALVVKSKTIGLMQHVSFSWEVDGDHFKQVSSVSGESIQMDQTLTSWTASLSQEELKNFFDLFFGVFIEAGILRFGDITVNTPAKIQKIIQNSQNMTPEQKAMIERISRLLIDTRVQVWKSHLPDLPKLTNFNLLDQLPNDLQDKIHSFIPDKTKDEA